LTRRGAPALGLDKLSTGAIVGSVLGVAGVTVIICIAFLIPYFHRRLVLEDWTLGFYHVFIGPALLFRGPVPPVPENVKVSVVQDFYRGKITKTDLMRDPSVLDRQYDEAVAAMETGQTKFDVPDSPVVGPAQGVASNKLEEEKEPFYKSPMAFWKFLKRTVLFGMFVDVVDEQNRSNGSKLDDILAKNVAEVHSYAHKYDNKVEYLYSMLQVFTATTASFAHGYILLGERELTDLDPTTFPMRWVR